ncbi:ubiquitin carboxyl-terminal hydrolase [bacterium]|nr:MAG: ubiquitin carboxyl-terminal hydrolase [bacterium]
MKKILLGLMLNVVTISQMFGTTKTTLDRLYKSPPVGINNYMGNSCFMNAAMQALYYIRPLTQHLFSQPFKDALVGNENTVAGKYVDFLEKLITTSPKALTTDDAKTFRDFITCRAMQSNILNEVLQVPSIIQGLRGEAYELKEIPPIQLAPGTTKLTKDQKNLYTNLHTYNNLIPFFENQQDSDEFLMPLIDSLITVDKKNNSVKKMLSFETKDTIQHKNITQANKSHKTEKTEQGRKLILNFSQPLPEKSSTTMPMEFLLDYYFQQENMTGDNQWFCQACNAKVDATKGILLDANNPMPEILIVQLNRFAYDMIQDITTKIYNPVPLNNYLILKSNYFSNQITEPVYYKLISFVLHQGPFGGGHYTAFVYNQADNHWWYCDDETTTKFESNEINKVLSAGIYPHDGNLEKKATGIFTPYLLFYQKTESPNQQMENLTTALQALKFKLAELATKLSSLK